MAHNSPCIILIYPRPLTNPRLFPRRISRGFVHRRAIVRTRANPRTRAQHAAWKKHALCAILRDRANPRSHAQPDTKEKRAFSARVILSAGVRFPARVCEPTGLGGAGRDGTGRDGTDNRTGRDRRVIVRTRAHPRTHAQHDAGEKRAFSVRGWTPRPLTTPREFLEEDATRGGASSCDSARPRELAHPCVARRWVTSAHSPRGFCAIPSDDLLSRRRVSRRREVVLYGVVSCCVSVCATCERLRCIRVALRCDVL